MRRSSMAHTAPAWRPDNSRPLSATFTRYEKVFCNGELGVVQRECPGIPGMYEVIVPGGTVVASGREMAINREVTSVNGSLATLTCGHTLSSDPAGYYPAKVGEQRLCGTCRDLLAVQLKAVQQ